MTSKERCLAAINRQPIDRTPVFPLLMFLSANRLSVSYKEFATNGSAMAQAQIKTYKTYDIDAVTARSDAFRISADLASEKMVYPEDQPPHLDSPIIKTAQELAELLKPDISNT